MPIHIIPEYILSPADCHLKAKECRELATIRTLSQPERIMLEHIAETWERIAERAAERN